jgi:hypothetical protein
MGDLERSRPAFVVDTAPSGLHGWSRFPLENLPRLETFVKTNYDAVTPPPSPRGTRLPGPGGSAGSARTIADPSSQEPDGAPQDDARWPTARVT